MKARDRRDERWCDATEADRKERWVLSLCTSAPRTKTPSHPGQLRERKSFAATLSSVFAMLVVLTDWPCRYCHGIAGPKKRRLSFHGLNGESAQSHAFPLFSRDALLWTAPGHHPSIPKHGEQYSHSVTAALIDAV